METAVYFQRAKQQLLFTGKSRDIACSLDNKGFYQQGMSLFYKGVLMVRSQRPESAFSEMNDEQFINKVFINTHCWKRVLRAIIMPFWQ
jgi:hypothetical protein